MTSLTPLALFKNLSEETRLTLVLLLRQAGELCVCELVSALEESQPKVSRHLAMLRESGLLIDRREGKWIYYRLSPHMPAWAAAIIEQAYLSRQQQVTELAQRALGAVCR
ncbi:MULTISPECIES: metalloregulator ArsR/SmtB family transcription factor [Serratia]|jgi:ArsR family transcriptional regulator|uniref:Metalloregulator ArsR/SmtB family transcription factor n=1 Tax=Serratia liquefaciens TaxID=614 RepID=A0ABX7DBB0_SERLI|nr:MULTISPECIES: metalloregulator ArsR/SmtB family transcription factor [Serratia]AGQ31809.1 ArsR family transcriptional regulator [Serratia liquefaciens ATCC 27592]AYO38768.1 ArsR family transcriptional regulator [Serratia sp. P2ACOL2]MBF8105722.1 metalloregulator ArsR/SmtB family transcription factor [Serratia liquefaciens]MBV0842578.1 metalloregulator ArsR/SmtB family transcription factor [Serratia liquefaciens]MCS4317522.1 ArsR family transcriptional regulator [Serratia sp. BIGb0234]